MKQLLVTLTLALTFLKIDAQVFEPNFLGDDFLLYKGVKIKLKNDSVLGFPFTFYSDLKYCNSTAEYNVIYRDNKYPKNTVSDSLRNRIFLVEDIIDRDGVPSVSSSILDKPIFILKDISTGQKIYYKYDNDFPFLTTPIIINEKNMCSKIKRSANEISQRIIYSSPETSNNQPSFAYIEKQSSNSVLEYFLSLQTKGGKSKTEGAGAIIYFTDGSKLSKQSKIDVLEDKKEYTYSIFISLSTNDIKLLGTKKIKKFKLHTHEREVNSVDADKFKAYVNCIKDAK